MRRGIAVVFSGLLAVGCTATHGEAGPVQPAGPVSASGPAPSQVSSGCGTTPVRSGGLPDWAASAGVPPLPTVMSHEGNLVGAVFGYPLMSPPEDLGRQNKVLWIVREPRGGSDLALTLWPEGGGDAVTISEPPASGPGEIYPSIVDVPAPGCWRVLAEWNGHRATLELAYQPR